MNLDDGSNGLVVFYGDNMWDTVALPSNVDFTKLAGWTFGYLLDSSNQDNYFYYDLTTFSAEVVPNVPAITALGFLFFYKKRRQ